MVDVRHEQAAAHAAEAYTRQTGKLGVAVVTAGPGVTDAYTGVANAWFSRTPMLLIGGRHFVRQEQKGGLQEVDHPRFFGASRLGRGPPGRCIVWPSMSPSPPDMLLPVVAVRFPRCAARRSVRHGR